MADIETLINFFKENGRTPTKREIKGYDSLVHKYGSWNAAIEAAGLQVNIKFTHSEEELIASLFRFSTENGKSPRASDCNTTSYLFDTGTYLRKMKCKTWAQVLRKAGLKEYFEISTLNHLNDDDLLSLINNIITLGNDTRLEFYNENRGSLPSFSTLQPRFGTWTNILKRLHIRPNLCKYSDSELISIYYEAKEYYGRVPTSSEIEKYSDIPFRNWSERLGAYNDFLESIGETPRYQTPFDVKFSNEELRQLYIKFSVENGYENGAPTRVLDSSPDICNHDVFAIRFGSLNKLRAACGFAPVFRGKTKYDRLDVFNHLRKIYKKFGGVPSIDEYKNLPEAIPISSIFRATCSTGLHEAFEKASDAAQKQKERTKKYNESDKGKLKYLEKRLYKETRVEKRAILIAKIETISRKIEEEKGRIKTVKKCTCCGIEKPYAEFHKNKKSRDGHNSYCNQCYRIKTKPVQIKYLETPRGQISQLKTLAKKAKKDSTLQKYLLKIAKLQAEIEKKVTTDKNQNT